MEPVTAWVRGARFAELSKMTEIFEVCQGSFVCVFVCVRVCVRVRVCVSGYRAQGAHRAVQYHRSLRCVRQFGVCYG